MIHQQDLMVATLRECRVTSPLVSDMPTSGNKSHFVLYRSRGYGSQPGS